MELFIFGESIDVGLLQPFWFVFFFFARQPFGGWVKSKPFLTEKTKAKVVLCLNEYWGGI